jgi:predicted dehydrogenase
MNFLILGDGPEELAWAQALADHPEHRLWAACPGFKAYPDLAGGTDLDGALATAGVEAILVGGDSELRAEGLRRAAAAGFPTICLHPPGSSADPYYQVSLSRQETGAVIVPDLPARLHPGVAELRKAIERQMLGAYRGIRFESSAGMADGGLVDQVLPRVIDPVRALLGEVGAVTATGDPPGERPTDNLLVVLRGPDGRRAEVRIWEGPPEPARLTVAGEMGTLTLEHDPAFMGSAHLIRKLVHGGETVTELEPWDPRAAILLALTDAMAGREAHPDLTDGIRTLELSEATARSLRKGRTIDLHYEEMSEAGTFKTLMTSAGCALLLSVLVLLPIALVGPAFGLTWTLYAAYIIPPLLILFIILQVFRFALRKS